VLHDIATVAALVIKRTQALGTVTPLVSRNARAEAERMAARAPGSALGAQARLLTLLGSNEPLPLLLDALARYVETWAPESRCLVRVSEPRQGVLVALAAPHLPQAFLEVLGEVPIEVGACTCGTAAARGELVVSDIASSPLWVAHRELALRHGVRACWCMPFKDEHDAVLGTLSLFYARVAEPTPEERDLIDFAAAMARMVLLRHLEIEDHRRRERRLRAVAQACADAILVHRDGRIIYMNATAAGLLGLPVSGTVDHPLSEFADPESCIDIRSHRLGQMFARLRHVDGHSVPVEVITAAGPAEAPPSTVLTCRDLRDQLAMEQATTDAMEEERERIAHDLHDGLCQQLAGLKYLLNSALVRTDPGAAPPLRELQALLETTLQDTATMATWLLPVARRTGGLAGALHDLARDTMSLNGVSFRVRATPPRLDRLNANQVEGLYQIARAAAVYALKDAALNSIDLELRWLGTDLQMTIAIDTPLFRGQEAPVALQPVRYRARRIGALLKLAPYGPRGSVLRVELAHGEQAG
jgi:PAS domain S-box-containing protein